MQGVPAALAQAVPVKRNAAAIMREERVFRKQLEDEERRLAGIEAGVLFDEVAFDAWRMAEEEKDRQVRHGCGVGGWVLLQWALVLTGMLA